MKQVVKIAKLKENEMLAKDLKGAIKEVLGSCVSIGVTIENEDPRKTQKDVDTGKYEELLTN